MEEIAILTTGGTIDKIYFDREGMYTVGEPQVAQVLQEANLVVPFRIRPVMRKDSLDMSDADRQLIRDAVNVESSRRILITHGTDTMAETARALVGIDGKTIVLTGSMQPARFRVNDALFNVAFAMAAVQTLPEGVYIAMHGRIFDPVRVRKNLELQRFEESGDNRLKHE